MNPEELIAFLDDRKLIANKTRVLDLGCGAGALIVPLAPRVRNVDGVESSETELRRAIARTIRFSNVKLHRGEFSKLDAIADATIDLVLAAGSMPGVVALGRDHTLIVFREVARCLKPGGRWVIAGFAPPEWDAARGEDELEKIARRTGFTALEMGEELVDLVRN